MWNGLIVINGCPYLPCNCFWGSVTIDLCVRETSEMVTATSERKSNITTGGAASGRNGITMKNRLIRAVMEINLSFSFLHTDVLQHCFSFCLQSITQVILGFYVFSLYGRLVGCFLVVDWLWDHGCCLKLLKVLRHWKIWWVQTIQQSTCGYHRLSLATGLVHTYHTLHRKVHTFHCLERKKSGSGNKHRYIRTYSNKCCMCI